MIILSTQVVVFVQLMTWSIPTLPVVLQSERVRLQVAFANEPLFAAAAAAKPALVRLESVRFARFPGKVALVRLPSVTFVRFAGKVTFVRLAKAAKVAFVKLLIPAEVVFRKALKFGKAALAVTFC